MNKQHLTCGKHWQNKEDGYLLLETLLAFMVAAVLLGFVVQAVSSFSIGLQAADEQIKLQEARRHILAQLEKTLAYDATKISLTDGNKINVVGLTGNKKISIYNDKNALYQRTTTGEGAGVNPLSLENVKVHSFLVQALDERRLHICFTLSVHEREQKIEQVIYCYNARVGDD